MEGISFDRDASSGGYYEQTSAVRFLHGLPRFGHGSDFSKLASSDRDEQADYAAGVLAVSFAILSLLVFWGAAVLTCKCMGKRRVGLCAGRARVAAGRSGKFRAPPRLWTVRLSFGVLGGAVILLSAVMVGPGLRSVNGTSVSLRRLNRDVKDLVTQGLLIMDSVKRVRWNVEKLDVDAVLDVGNACPNPEGNVFASDRKMRRAVRGLKRDFEELREYFEDSDFEGMRNHVDNVLDGTEHVDAAVSVVEGNDWTVRMFALALNVLVLFMVGTSCVSSGGRRRCPPLRWMAELLILPLFVVCIVVSWFATSAMAFASIANADFCMGNARQSGPSGTVMDMFEERGIASDDALFRTFLYYQSGCATEDPIEGLYGYEDDIQGGIASASDFLSAAEGIGLEEINERCGANARHILEGIGMIKDNLGILLGALRSTYELASCSKMSPVYRQVFEGTACTESSGSLTLMFTCMFGINVAGMLMIMLRSAMYPYKRVLAFHSVEEEDDEWEEYQAYLGYMANFVAMWGGEEETSKTGTHETSSSTDSADDAGGTASDAESPLVSRTPARDAPQRRADAGDFFAARLDATLGEADSDEFYSADIGGSRGDEERMPLSPGSAELFAWGSDGAGMDASQAKRLTYCGSERKEFLPCNDEGLRPLSPGSVRSSTDSTTKIPDRSRMETPRTKPDFGSEMKGFVPVRFITSGSGGVELEESSSRSPRRRRRPLGRGEDSFPRRDPPAEKHRPASLSSQTHPSTTNTERSADESEERDSLSPGTPSLRLGGSWGRRSPSFLSSRLPQTPSISSPKDGQRDGVNYFGSIISPLRSSPLPSVKRE